MSDISWHMSHMFSVLYPGGICSCQLVFIQARETKVYSLVIFVPIVSIVFVPFTIVVLSPVDTRIAPMRVDSI